MYVDFNRELFFIDDKYVKNSPYLNTLYTTKSNVDTYIHKINDIDQVIYIVDNLSIHNNSFFKYLKLMSGQSVDVPARLLDYMGHSNYLGYPNDYWCVKIHDNWVRDNFYTLDEIMQDPYYDLEEVKIRKKEGYERYLNISNNIKKYISDISNLYVAGGAAMYMAGVIDDIRDIDIFTTNKDKVMKSIIPNKSMYHTGNSLSIPNNVSGEFIYNSNGQLLNPKGVGSVQIILREYKTPSEIVHGFDLDCCGYIYEMRTDKLYRTKRAAYSTLNRINYFDPERSSPSYASRLSKYNLRNFKIWIPYQDILSFNTSKYIDVLNNIIKAIEETIEKHNIIIEPESLRYGDLYTLDELNKNSNGTEWYWDKELLNSLKIKKPKFRELVKYMIYISSNNKIPLILILTRLLFSDTKKYIPNDPASILFFAIYKNIYIGSEDLARDYDIYSNIQEYSGDTKLTWKTYNPMEQDKRLTGTFYPEPITMNIQEWYAKSPLITFIDA